MRQRRVVILVGLASVAAVAGVATTLWTLDRQPAVTVTTIARLTPGMSEADVKAVLGSPAADLTARPPAGVRPPLAGGRLLEYTGVRATAWVEFDGGGRLVRCHPPVVRVVTGLERLRLRLNWWW
jgi:hypothetical protein